MKKERAEEADEGENNENDEDEVKSEENQIRYRNIY